MSEAAEQINAAATRDGAGTREQAPPRRLALEDLHLRAGARMSERDGWLVPASYGDAAAEYEAVRGAGGAGLIDLSPRGRVGASGREAVQFLNGLVTNDVKALAPGAWVLAALPNPQGRLLAFARVLRPGEEESFILDTEPATRETVFRSLERFTLAGDFRVRDLSDETAQLSLQGARASGIVRALLGQVIANLERGRAALARWRESEGVTVARATHTGEDGFDLFAGAAAARELWEAIAHAGALPVGYDALEVLRVEAGVPRYGVDVTDANVVSEAGLDEAVSYTKGCYVGQEIIARIHWRGHVAKRLAGLVLEGDGRGAFADEDGEAVTRNGVGVGAKITNADASREIGRVTSSAFSPRLGRRIALAVVKYDFLAPGTEVLIEGEGGARRARVASLPLVRGGWHAGGEASS
ncbi:MAG: aminomethyltransferase family protein [Pyrinomonadaceae bacterium]